MKKIVFLLFFVTILAFSAYAYYDKPTDQGRSSLSLVNPPNSSALWTFKANQKVWIELTNGNVLGVIGSLAPPFGHSREFFAILPYSSKEYTYDILSTPQIFWQFHVEIRSDAALLYCNAYWYEYDPLV